MIHKIAFTIMIASFVLSWVAARLDSPFPGIMTPWTYIAAWALIFSAGSAIVGSVAWVWGA